MIDVHAHFADEGYELSAEWEKIKAAGVEKVILAGDTLEHSRMHRDFAATHEGAYFTVGIHPEHARLGLYDGIFKGYLELGCEEKCVAVGEIGLDYHYEGYDKAVQRELFVRQIMLATELGLPLQIHSRDACADTLAILRDFRPVLKKHGFLMHCYSYGGENLDAFAELGGYFSFGGVTCFKNARRAVEAVAACPLERLLSETDSPYLSPFRGEKNSPANIPVIVDKLAQIKELSATDMAAIIEQNAKRLFSKLK